MTAPVRRVRDGRSARFPVTLLRALERRDAIVFWKITQNPFLDFDQMTVRRTSHELEGLPPLGLPVEGGA
jgi:hypothetical protein